MSRHPQRERGGSSSSASSTSSSTSSSGGERARLLALLDAQCRDSTGVGGLAGTSSGAGYTLDGDAEDASTDGSEEEDDDQELLDGEWTGIDDDAAEEAPTSTSTAVPTVVYDDGSTGRRAAADRAERGAFMSAKVRRPADPYAASSRSRPRKAADDEEAEEERQLKQLDSTLYTLIKDLPADGSASAASLLPQLSALPDPRLTTRREAPKPIDKRAPRLLREALYASRLERAKARHEEARQSGTVLAHAAKAGRGRGSGSGKRAERDPADLAVTKRQRRLETGAEDERRTKARGLGSVVGKMRKGGSVLTLNRDEIRRGNEGDFDGLAGRRRGSAGSRGRGGAAGRKGHRR